MQNSIFNVLSDQVWTPWVTALGCLFNRSSKKKIMGMDCQISFKKKKRTSLTKWAVGSKCSTAIPWTVCSVCTRHEILPDTFSKKQVYSNVSAKVKDTRRESWAQWSDRMGRMESMEEAIKQILLITLLLRLTINRGSPLGEPLSFYLKKKSHGWRVGAAAKIIKSALIIPVFPKPHGEGSIKCHCREVHFEL